MVRYSILPILSLVVDIISLNLNLIKLFDQERCTVSSNTS